MATMLACAPAVSSIGSRPFLSALLRKMSANELDSTAWKP
jgi:hypothetical protein